MSQNTSSALNYFIQQGWSPQQAAGIVGNLMQESGLNPTVNPGDSGKSFGIAQWNGNRLSALQQYADQQGGDWHDLNMQLGFIQNELGGSENKAGQALRAAQTIPDATAAFAGFERPQGWTPDNPQGANAYDKRLQYAMQSLGGDSVIDSPQPGITTTAQSYVGKPLANAAMVTPSAIDAFSKLQSAQSDALAPLQQQPMQAQAQQPEISDQDVAAELQRRGIAPQAQQQPDLSDEQIKQELIKRGLSQPEQTIGRAAGLTARAGLQGLAAIPNMIGDAANAGINLGSMGINALTGSKIPMMQYPGDITESALNQFLPQPETGAEKIANFGGQALASFGSPGSSMLEAGAKAVAPVADAAIAKLAPKTGTALATVEKPNLPVAASDVFAASRENYNKLPLETKALDESGTNDFLGKINDLKKEPATVTAAFGKDAARDIVDNLNSVFTGKSLNLDEVAGIDQRLGREADKFWDAGRMTAQGKEILDIQSHLRDAVENAPGNDVLKQARQDWAAAMRMQDIERIMQRASLMDNPQTGIKTGMRTLLTNQNRIRGFNDAEKALIEKAAKTGVVGDLFRVFGSRLLPIGATATGHPLAALASHAATAGIRGIGTKIQGAKAQAVIDQIAKRSSLKQGVR